MKTTEILDDLTNLRDLVDVCSQALLYEGARPLIVGHVLYFHVLKQIEIIQENLETVQEK
jgi:hypothetical protein